MISVLSFYGMSFFLAILAFPLCFHGLKLHRDRGFTSCKVLGLVMITFMHGCMGRLGLNPWSLTTMSLLFYPVIAAWFLWFVWYRKSVLGWLQQNFLVLLKLEAGFLVVFLLGLWLVANNPGLLGTEKLMDFALLKSVFRSDVFPPIDPWFAGRPLNYYWFGHHTAALLCKLASVPLQVGYNLMLAFLLALVFISACGLFLGGRMNLPNSLLGATIVALAGNVVPLWHILSMGGDFAFTQWEATRTIPYTITEFPFSSLLVGDLHAHFLLLPSLILFVIWLMPGSRDRVEGSSVVIKIGVLNLLFSAAIWGNPWNLPVLGLVFFIFKGKNLTTLPWVSLLPSLLMWPVLYEVQGHPLLIKWVAAQDTSPLGHFFLMWGMPLTLLTAYCFCRHKNLRSIQKKWYLLLISIPFFLHSPPAGTAMTLAILLWLTAGNGEDQIWHVMAICGLIVIVVPEYIYLNDSYISPYKRMNTVFKLYYAAWVLLMSASCYAVTQLNVIIQRVSPGRGTLFMSLWIMVFFVYPVLAIGERTHFAQDSPTLNSFSPIKKAHLMDMKLINWLERNLQVGDVCLEVPGTSYSWAGRISALTGCPTVMGWEQHQILWRPESRVHDRTVDAKMIYASDNDTVRKKLIDKYNISWVIIGELELQTFNPHSLSSLEGILSKKMTQGEGGIYAVEEKFQAR